jgi:hypothetical protein
MRGGGAGSVSALEKSRGGAGAAKEAPEGDTTEDGLAEGRNGGDGVIEPGTPEAGAGTPSGPLGSPSMGAGAGNVVEPDGAGSVFEALGDGGGSEGGGREGGGGDDGTGVAGSSRCCVATR